MAKLWLSQDGCGAVGGLALGMVFGECASSPCQLSWHRATWELRAPALLPPKTARQGFWGHPWAWAQLPDELCADLVKPGAALQRPPTALESPVLCEVCCT